MSVFRISALEGILTLKLLELQQNGYSNIFDFFDKLTKLTKLTAVSGSSFFFNWNVFIQPIIYSG